MATESLFVGVAHQLLEHEFRKQPLEVRRGAALLYQVTVDNNLRVMASERVRNPRRGDSAFQTDLAIFEKRDAEVSLPRVVLEFKTRISTHDVLTYSTKAEKHKAIYPYLRYGLVASNESYIPGRFFTHNEGIDFCLCAGGLSEAESARAFAQIIRSEVECSRVLERVAFGQSKARIYRTDVVLQSEP